MTLTKLALVDDHVLFREGLSAILSVSGQFQVVAQGGTALEAVDIAVNVQPDILLLDVELHDIPAVITVRNVHRRAPSVVVAILTMHRDSILRNQLFLAGAAAYITKSTASVDLIKILQRISNPDLGDQPARTMKMTETELSVLSTRELEVLRLISMAKSNRQIAAELSISVGTVKRHTSNISAKLETRSRMESVRKAISFGFSVPDTELG